MRHISVVAGATLLAFFGSPEASAAPIYSGTSGGPILPISREDAVVRFSITGGSIFGAQTILFERPLLESLNTTVEITSGAAFEHMVTGLTNGILNDTLLLTEVYIPDYYFPGFGVEDYRFAII